MAEHFGERGFDMAKKCFKDNANNFAPVASEPEKNNLYNGLWQLTVALEGMAAQIDALTLEVTALKQRP